MEQSESESICEQLKRKAATAKTDAFEHISGQRWIAPDFINWAKWFISRGLILFCLRSKRVSFLWENGISVYDICPHIMLWIWWVDYGSLAYQHVWINFFSPKNQFWNSSYPQKLSPKLILSSESIVERFSNMHCDQETSYRSTKFAIPCED